MGFDFTYMPSDENCENLDYLNVAWNPMTMLGELTSSGTINITGVSFIPEACVDKVHDGTGVLKQVFISEDKMNN